MQEHLLKRWWTHHRHPDTPLGYVVLSLILIGIGLGLVITPASNMIMNPVSRSRQGMISSLTSLERFAPLTIGIAVYNLIFVEGVIRIAASQDIAQTAPAAMKVQVLSAGFDLAFFGSLVIGLVILVLTFVTHEEIHPDNRDRPAGDELPSGML